MKKQVKKGLRMLTAGLLGRCRVHDNGGLYGQR